MFGYFLAITALLAWGLVVIPLKKTETSGLYGIGISMPIAFAILLAPALFVFLQEGIVFSSWNMLLATLVGILQFSLGTAFYYEGIRLAGTSVGAPLTRLKPIFIGFIVFIAGIELLSFNLILSAVIVSIGIVMLAHTSRSDAISRDRTKKGVIFALSACFCWAIGDILVKQIQIGPEGLHPLLLTEIALLAGLVGYYLVIFLEKKQDKIFKMSKDDKRRYAIHGVVSLSIAYLAFFASMGIIGLMKAVIITAAWPLISMIVGFVLFRERFTWLKLLGGILVIMSIYLVLL